jgi:quercetin dioxygenase-like cupin family protein
VTGPRLPAAPGVSDGPSRTDAGPGIMAPMPHTLIPDLPGRAEIPAQGTLSRILHDDDRLRLVLFAFGSGQELTEHTASVPTVLQVLPGPFRVTAGEDTFAVGPEVWLLLDPHEAHSLPAREPSCLLLTILRPGPGWRLPARARSTGVPPGAGPRPSRSMGPLVSLPRWMP